MASTHGRNASESPFGQRLPRIFLYTKSTDDITTDFEIGTCDGAPSGAMNFTSTVGLIVRQDASNASDVFSVTLDSGSTWTKLLTADLANGLSLPDSASLRVGTGNDLTISHDGTNTTIDHNTGELIFAVGTRTITFDPEIGGEVKRLAVDSGVVSLTTSGATTAITLNIPSGARLLGVAANITTAVAGVSSSSVTATLAFTGGSTVSIGTFVSAGDGNLAKNTKLTALLPFSTSGLVTTNTTNVSLVFSGGADNTPSAGAIRVLVWYETLAALDSAD